MDVSVLCSASSSSLTPFSASPLTEPPPQTPGGMVIEDTPTKKTPKKRKPKERKQLVDSITELQEQTRRKQAQNGLEKVDVSDIITNHAYLSTSATVMRLLEIRNDPTSYFFPTTITDEGAFYCAGTPGLAPELSNLFLFPAAIGAGQKRKGKEQGERATKRQRLGSEAVDDFEQLRHRASSNAPGFQGDGDIGGFDAGFGDDSGFIPNDDFGHIDNFQFQVEDSLHLGKQQSRHTTPGADLFDETAHVYADADCPVAIFDTQPLTQDASTQAEATQRALEEKDTEAVDKDGYSRNTVKAIGLLKDALEEEEEDTLSFTRLTDKVFYSDNALIRFVNSFSLGYPSCSFFILLRVACTWYSRLCEA